MYIIESSKFGNFEKIFLRNEATQEYAAIIPDFGANLNEVVLSNGLKTFPVVDGDVNAHDLVINAVYKSAKLTPFPNRINKGKYEFEGNTHELLTNMPPHAIHGLVFDKSFTIVSKIASSDSAALTVMYPYRMETVGFPFSFDVYIEYLLDADGLTTTTTITNTGEGNIPVGDGWHMYFQCPCKIDDCLLTVPSDYILIPDSTLIPTGDKKAFTLFNAPLIFSNTTFDDCFSIVPDNKIAEVVLTDVQNDLSVISWQETGERKYNYLQIFTPLHRETMAIEPMTCQPDAFNNHEGLIILKPQEQVVLRCGIKAERARPNIG